jgi:DNA polymerase III subunit epsilon
MMTLLLCVAAFLLFIWIGRTEDAKKAKRITQHPQEPLLSDYVVDEVLKEPVILILNDKPKKLSLEVSFVAIDFETANRRRGSACAIGMCKIENGIVVDRYKKYLRPVPFEFESMNTAVHGIRASDTVHALTIAEDWANIKAFVGDLQLVAHNASFDRSVLDNSLEACGLKASGWHIACTMLQAKRIFEGEITKLRDLCQKFEISLNHHDAGSDAEACALVRLELLAMDMLSNERLVKTKPTPIKTEIEVVSEVLKGLTIVFTGEFDTMSRSEIESLARSHGARVTGSVSRKTSYLVQGYIFASNKLENAHELGIAIIKEKDLLKLIIGEKKVVGLGTVENSTP